MFSKNLFGGRIIRGEDVHYAREYNAFSSRSPLNFTLSCIEIVKIYANSGLIAAVLLWGYVFRG
ncbi:MAG: hypothetical protein D6712_19885 [Chloroflexi bacterium]|nr:MAG: hypothetical protein D6712_19885 [Chloroflexota bacterium]